MIRRLKKRRATVWCVLAAIVSLIVVRLLIDFWFADPLAAPSQLTDGPFRVERIIDPITFVVRKDIEGSKPFRLRLVGIKISQTTNWQAESQAMQMTSEFIDRGRPIESKTSEQRIDPLVSLQFDRTYLSNDQTALAYLLINDEILNIELSKAGLVVPDPIIGNSPSMQRKIRKAADYAKNMKLGMHLNSDD